MSTAIIVRDCAVYVVMLRGENTSGRRTAGTHQPPIPVYISSQNMNRILFNYITFIPGLRRTPRDVNERLIRQTVVRAAGHSTCTSQAIQAIANEFYMRRSTICCFSSEFCENFRRFVCWWKMQTPGLNEKKSHYTECRAEVSLIFEVGRQPLVHITLFLCIRRVGSRYVHIFQKGFG